MYQWVRQDNAAAWSSQLIQRVLGRAGSASHASSLVYELFFTNLPQGAFTTSDVVALYLHRGAFETVLSDEDSKVA
jgi:hypothetical protein